MTKKELLDDIAIAEQMIGEFWFRFAIWKKIALDTNMP